jgi:hypothetical protein
MYRRTIMNPFFELMHCLTQIFVPPQVEEVELIDKKGYLTISLTLTKEGSKILLRRPEGIREWYQDLKVRLMDIF